MTAEAVKSAKRIGLLVESDLWGSDEALWRKLNSAAHPEVRRRVALITPGARFTWDEAQPLFNVATKVRSIDPLVADRGLQKYYQNLIRTLLSIGANICPARKASGQ